MALTYGFYDSLNGDRKYNAKQWSSIFDGVVRDGVLASVGQCFICSATGSDMIITVGSGRAWFDHTWILSDGDPNAPITFSWATGTDFAPEPALTRIDAIVIQTDSSPSVRANSITRVKGTPGGGKPSMTHFGYVNQYAIAYVTVYANATSLSNANIENAVGTTGTPFVTGILQVLDSNALLQQWASDYANWKSGNNTDYANWRTAQQALFLSWFDNLEDYLTPSAEATLTSHVSNLERTLTATFTVAGWTQASGDDKWSQTVQVAGMNASFNPVLVRQLAAGATLAQQRAYNKAFSILGSGYGTTANNSVTMYVYKVPATDILVGFKGV